MELSVKSFDWEETRRRVLALPDALVTDAVGFGCQAAAKGAAKRARAHATFKDKTGYLRRSIITRRVGWRYGSTYVPKAAALLLATAPHAHLVEGGTRHMPARPFLQPAIKDTAALSKDFGDGMERNVRTIFRQMKRGIYSKKVSRALAGL